jgi:hypothetical protein
LAGIFCSGSLTTATPNPAATKASALAAPSASLTIRGPNLFQAAKTQRTEIIWHNDQGLPSDALYSDYTAGMEMRHSTSLTLPALTQSFWTS